eukprot:m.386002 g.386002  ORF g.386002 m.386002 type:complete len:70 (-) comp21012_c0_seq5:2359-2568(-)
MRIVLKYMCRKILQAHAAIDIDNPTGSICCICHQSIGSYSSSPSSSLSLTGGTSFRTCATVATLQYNAP